MRGFHWAFRSGAGAGGCYRSRMGRWVLLVIVAACLGGCSDLESYEGDYSGPVVGADGESFIRRGFPAGAVLDITGFDPPPSDGSIGTISAREPGDTGATLFRAELERIAPLAHDQLSGYDFPGGNRVRNYIFVVRPTEGTGLLVGREAFVFVSLLDDGVIEVRVISGTGDEDDDHFGLFILDSQ